MPLEWTHDWAKCPKQKTTCPGDTTCSEFPTPADRIDMARAAYEEWSEGTGWGALEKFVLDVEMLARAEGLEQKVWVVTEHEPDCSCPVVIRGIFAAGEDAQQFVALLDKNRYRGWDELWWETHEWVVHGPGENLARLL